MTTVGFLKVVKRRFGTLPSEFNTNTIQDVRTLTTTQASINNINLGSGSVNNTTPNSTSIASTNYVDEKIASLIGSTPSLLDSLQEISSAINNDPQFSQSITNQLSTKADINQINTFSQPQNFTTINLNGNNLTTKIDTMETNLTTLNNKTSNIDNTSDLNKPISNATQLALNLKANVNNPTFTTGITTPSINLNGTDLNTRIQTGENKITTLENKTNSIAFNSSTNTTTINGNLSVSIDISNDGNTVIGNNWNDRLTINSQTTINNNVVLGATRRITAPNITLGSTDLNTRLTNNETNTTNLQTSVNNINTNLTNLTYNSTTGTTTINNNFQTNSIVDNGNLTVRGNTVLGDSSTDTLAINGDATFNNAIILNGSNLNTRINTSENKITNLENKTSNIDNTSDLNKPISNATQLALNLKSNIDNPIFTTGITTPAITLNSVDLGTRLNNIDTAITSKANDNDVVKLTNNQTITGLKTFTTTPKINTFDIATMQDISNLVNSAPETLNTLNELASALGNDPNFATTISNQIGLKANINNPIFTTGITTPAINLNGSDLNTTLSTYQPISGMSNYLTTASASSTYQPISGMSNYLTTASASSTYQPISGMSNYVLNTALTSTLNNYTTLNSIQTISAQKTFSAPSQFSKIFESITSGTVSSNSMSLDFSTINGLISCSPSSANNFTLVLTNVPVIANNMSSYTISLLINTATNKNFCNSITVNGSNITPIAIGGLSNVSVNASSIFVLQTISIVYINSSTPTRIFTSVASLF